MKKRVIFLLFILICFILTAVSCFAAVEDLSDESDAKDALPPVVIDVKAVNDRIVDDGFASFNVLITNNLNFSETFHILYSEDPLWTFQVVPLLDKEKVIPANSRVSIRILVKETGMPDGMHNIKLSIFAEKTKKTYNTVLSTIVGPLKLPLIPNFSVSANVPSKMDPRNPYQVIVNIDNKNALALNDVKIELDSKLIKDKTVVDINPNDKKSVSFAVLLMASIPPQSDSLSIKVVYQNKTYYDSFHNFQVVEYILPFKKETSTKKSFFKTTRVINLTNEGNVNKNDTIKIQTSWREKPFAKISPKAKVTKENEKVFFTWPVEIKPQEQKQIQIITSYRILIWLILIILGLLVYYYATKNPLIAKKSVAKTHREHKALLNITVMFQIRNKSSKPVSALRIIERVPEMLAIKQDSFSGSIHPNKLHKHDREGTLLEYRLAELEPKDERMFKYTAYSKLHIIGDLKIKPTVITFKDNSGKKTKAKSNSLFILGDPEEKKKQQQN